MITLCVATQSDGYFDYLIESFENHENNYKILGFNQKWQGWKWRTELLIEYLKQSNDDIVCITDAYDVICLQNDFEIEKRFKSLHCDVLFSLEYPKQFLIRFIQYFLFDSNISFGLFMGYRQHILSLLEKSMEMYDHESDDQVIMSHILKHVELENLNIKYDYDSYIFKNISCSNMMAYLKNDECENNDEIQSCYIHGPSNINMNKYIDNYNGSERLKSDYILTNVSDHLKRFIKHIILIMLLVTIMIMK